MPKIAQNAKNSIVKSETFYLHACSNIWLKYLLWITNVEDGGPWHITQARFLSENYCHRILWFFLHFSVCKTKQVFYPRICTNMFQLTNKYLPFLTFCTTASEGSDSCFRFKAFGGAAVGFVNTSSFRTFTLVTF